MWINTQVMAQRDAAGNPPEPFFLYMAHNMPHAPVFASPEFQGKSKGGRFGDVIEEIDWSVGQVMKAIKDAGVENNTLIIFTSDNGPWSMFGPHGGTAAPLRGEKGTCWEGGYRVPGIFRWPGKIKPGTVNDQFVSNLDFAETFLDAAGLAIPSDMQGRSMKPILLGQDVKDWRKSFYYHYYEFPGPHSVRRHYGIRTERYKLINYYGVGEWELFDMQKDPQEMRSVYADPEYAATVKDLKGQLAGLRTKYKDDGTVSGAPPRKKKPGRKKQKAE